MKSRLWLPGPAETCIRPWPGDRGYCHSPVAAAICSPGDSCLGKENPLTFQSLFPQWLRLYNTTQGPGSEPSIPATAGLALRKPRVKGTRRQSLAAGRKLQPTERGVPGCLHQLLCVQALPDPSVRTLPLSFLEAQSFVASSMTPGAPNLESQILGGISVSEM